MDERVCVIVNPVAGRGRAARMIPEISARFAEIGVSDIRTTAHKGDEAGSARQAIADGFTTLVAVGGDGTTSNVANAILHSGSDARLAVMSAGTGNDFAKVLGTERASAETIARLCVEPAGSRVDVGRIEDVFFVNCCGFGFDVAVLEEIRRTRWLRGSSVYLYTAVRQIFGFAGIEVEVRSEESHRPAQLHMLLVIANSANFGGMFRIAPNASVTDGCLDAVSILFLPPARRIAMLVAATMGAHESQPGCVMERSRSFELKFEAAPTYETDGELHRARTASLDVISCPLALRVVTGPARTLS
ncbi:MAG: YegS/Rv2252/BmrU family lipid kinase [Gemmatimonadaceae bacterium]|nr:YegS/Rv2252/BmrU family lipid kinase [Gemmatimonadaceae bacterium]